MLDNNVITDASNTPKDLPPLPPTPVTAGEAENGTGDEGKEGSDMDMDNSDDEDKMSLSSISSGEEKLEVIAPALPPPMGFDPSVPPPNFMNQNSQAENATNNQWMGQPHNFNQNFNNNFNSTNSFNGNNFGPNFMNVPSNFNNMGPNQNFPVNIPPPKEDPSQPSFDGTLKQIMKELKLIMKKDLCKKMIENSAFKCFENWWDFENMKTKVGSHFQ